jgi:Tol biopolymer transport system component
VALLACGDGSTEPDPPQPQPGAIAVSTRTSGLDLTPYYYRFAAGNSGGWLRPGVGDTVRGLSPGNHSVRLIGLPHHCSTPANPYVAQVVDSQITPVVFEIACDRAEPDRIRVAFSTSLFSGEKEDIFGTDADGLGLVKLTNHPAKDSQPVWSPDGSRIAFLSDRGSPGFQGLHVMSSDGTGLRRLSGPGSPEVTALAWFPDGSRLAYATGDQKGDVYLIGVDGTGGSLVPGLGDTLRENTPGLDWAPDGKRLALVVGRRNEETGGALWLAVVSVEDGAVELLDSFGLRLGIRPRWSPDGERLLYSRTTNFRCDFNGCSGYDSLMVAPLEGTEPIAVGVPGHQVAWTPDGDHIISDSSLISLDGSGRSDMGVLPLGDLQWSREGSETEFPCMILSQAAGGLCRMGPDGSNPRLAVSWFLIVRGMVLRPWPDGSKAERSMDASPTRGPATPLHRGSQNRSSTPSRTSLGVP